MAFIEQNFSILNRKLRYGVIYVVTSLRNSDHDNNIAKSFIPRLLSLLRSLTGFDIQVVESTEAEGTVLVARRINVGNVGTDSMVKMPLNYESVSDVKRFVKSATDVLSTDKGDQVLEQEDYLDLTKSLDDLDSFDSSIIHFSEKNRSQSAEETKKKLKDRLRERFSRKQGKSLESYFEKYCDDYIDEEERAMPAASAPAEVDLEEEALLSIEQQQEEALKAIQALIIEYVRKFHADPSELIHKLLKGKIVIGKEVQQSPLVVNKDLKIVLPNYNEMEVKMPAMCRAIYILFLKHPEGIALRDIAEHRADLEDIYSMVMPGRSEEKAKEAIDNLVDPMSNTLNEYISKIKRCFKLCIVEDELVNKYCITGKRGETYVVALDPTLITLPRAVMG